MKLSTKGRYGLRVMTAIAALSGEERRLVSVPEISAHIGVTCSYIEKLISILKKHKFVEASRGQSGGYCLPREADLISVGEILRALENDLKITACATGCCSNSCPSKDVFYNLYKMINDYLDGVSLKSLVDKEKK